MNKTLKEILDKHFVWSARISAQRHGQPEPKFTRMPEEGIDTDQALADIKKLIFTSFKEYVDWNWSAGLGYGENERIFKRAIEDNKWFLKAIDMTEEEALNKLTEGDKE